MTEIEQTEQIAVQPVRINKTANMKEYLKEYYQRNKVKMKEQANKYRKANPEKQKLWCQKWRAKIKRNVACASAFCISKKSANRI